MVFPLVSSSRITLGHSAWHDRLAVTLVTARRKIMTGARFGALRVAGVGQALDG